MTKVATCAISECGTPAACDADNFVVLRTRTDQLTINGRSYTKQYDRCPNGASTPAPLETYTTQGTQRQWQRRFDVLGRVTSYGIVDGRADALFPTGYSYDSDGRLASITRGDRMTTFDYHPVGSTGSSGALQSVTIKSTGPIEDPHQVLFDSYDAAGRLMHMLLAGDRALQLGRDGSGNIASITPPGRAPHLLPHDALNRLAQYSPAPLPEQTITTYQYDSDRRLALVAQPGDVPITSSYDSRGRLKSLSHPSRTFTFSYETGTAAATGLGRLLSIVDQTGATLSYGYGPTGSIPLSRSWSGATLTGSVSQTLDVNHRLSTESVNGTGTIAYAYDDDGLLTGVGALTLTRDPANGLLKSTALDDVTETRTHNRFGELATSTVRADNTIVYQVAYEGTLARDNLGRVRRKRESVFNVATGTQDTTVRDYVYDSAGHLWRVLDGTNGNILEEYDYDANGNRTLASVNGMTITDIRVDAQDRLTTYGGTTFTYTAKGERRTKTVDGLTTTYDWDGYSNLVAVSSQNMRIEYFYDAQQRRIGRKKWNTGMTPATLVDERRWLYGNQLRIVAELDGSNNVISRFVYGIHMNVPDYAVLGGQTFRVVADQLGTVHLLVRASDGSIAQRFDYPDAFGAGALSGGQAGFPFAFAGGLTDADTGLVRFGARDYDPVEGVWLRKEPRLFAGGTNLYSYCGNDPINWHDVDGNMKLPPTADPPPPEWTVDPTHQDPNGVRLRHPSGDTLDFHKGRPGRPGWRGKDHWHHNGGKDHLPPGADVPDPPPVCNPAPQQSTAPSADQEGNADDEQGGDQFHGDPIVPRNPFLPFLPSFPGMPSPSPSPSPAPGPIEFPIFDPIFL